MRVLESANSIFLFAIFFLIFVLIISWLRAIKFVDSQTVIRPQFSLFFFEAVVAPVVLYFGFPFFFASCNRVMRSIPFSIYFSIVGVIVTVAFVTMFFCRLLFKKQKSISKSVFIKLVIFELVLFIFVFVGVVFKCKSWVLMVSEHSVGMYFISSSFYLSVAFSMFFLVALNVLSLFKRSFK